MKEMCEFCEKMVEMQPTYTTMYIGIGKNEDVPIEILYMRCPECGDGHYLNPSAYELFQIKKMLIRGKNNLLHWTDIIAFQKQMQWSDEELSEFVAELSVFRDLCPASLGILLADGLGPLLQCLTVSQICHCPDHGRLAVFVPDSPYGLLHGFLGLEG